MERVFSAPTLPGALFFKGRKSTAPVRHFSNVASATIEFSRRFCDPGGSLRFFPTFKRRAKFKRHYRGEE
jgi:hypothetical protein